MVRQPALVSGQIKSCGCNKFRYYPTFIDLTGKKFGKFTVLKRVDPPENAKVTGSYWLCQCECGNTRILRAADINRENQLSCGECSKNKFDIIGDFGIGYTTKNEPFYFDKDDYDLIKKYTWCINSDGYVVAWDIDSEKFVYMHRLVTGLTYKDEYIVDHRYHRKNDNRKEQLRICSYTENNRNLGLSKNNTSGVTGVVWEDNVQMWCAQIGIDYKTIRLLYTHDFNEAVKARKAAEEKYFKEYSYDNSMKGSQLYEEKYDVEL